MRTDWLLQERFELIWAWLYELACTPELLVFSFAWELDYKSILG